MPASDPREVIAGASRKQHRVAYEHEWTKTDLDYYHGNVADAIITALHDAGYEIVRADREPDAPEITEAMVEVLGELRNTLIQDVRETKGGDAWAKGWRRGANRAVGLIDAMLEGGA